MSLIACSLSSSHVVPNMYNHKYCHKVSRIPLNIIHKSNNLWMHVVQKANRQDDTVVRAAKGEKLDCLDTYFLCFRKIMPKKSYIVFAILAAWFNTEYEAESMLLLERLTGNDYSDLMDILQNVFDIASFGTDVLQKTKEKLQQQ